MYLETNEIISACRLPISYWEIATGETEVWKNPGKCVMSWLIATCLDQDMTVLPKELREKYDQCVNFSSNIALILSLLEAAVEKLVWRIEDLGFEATGLKQQTESLFGSIDELRSKAVSDSAFITKPMNRHKLITLANVYLNVEDQLTHQEKRIDKK